MTLPFSHEAPDGFGTMRTKTTKNTKKNLYFIWS